MFLVLLKGGDIESSFLGVQSREELGLCKLANKGCRGEGQGGLGSGKVLPGVE